MITRGSALGIGLLAVALASLAMVIPLWYLASERRELFNALVLFSVSFALAAAVFSRLRGRLRKQSSRRGRGLP